MYNLELLKDTKLPQFDEVEKYNKKDQYVGLELKFHIAEDLFLRISVQNETKIFNYPTDDIIYVSLCTGNDFPICNARYKYCHDGYVCAIRDVFLKANNIIDGLKNFNCCVRKFAKTLDK